MKNQKVKIVNATKGRRGMRDAFGKWHFANPGEIITVTVKNIRTFLGFKPADGYVPDADLGEHDPNKGTGGDDANKAEVARIKAMKKEELQEYLYENGVAYSDDDNKPALLELALAHQAGTTED